MNNTFISYLKRHPCKWILTGRIHCKHSPECLSYNVILVHKELQSSIQLPLGQHSHYRCHTNHLSWYSMSSLLKIMSLRQTLSHSNEDKENKRKGKE